MSAQHHLLGKKGCQSFIIYPFVKALRASLLTVGLSMAVVTVVSTEAQAQLVEKKYYDITAGALASSLNAFANQAEINLSYAPELVAQKQALDLSGHYGAEEGLWRLLDGSGLAVVPSNGGFTLVELPTDQDVIRLDAVWVSGKPLTDLSNGAVDGYIARRSSTATKTGMQIMDIPQSISVVTQDQMEVQGVHSLVQALRYSSGVTAEIRGSATRYDIPYVRGFGSPSDPIQFQDGLRLLRGPGYAIPQVETFGSERIELLKGPSSTLYGSAIPGGLINVSSKRPTEEAQGELQLQFGSDNRYQAALDLSGPATDDGSVLYRVVTLGKVADTQVVNTKEERFYIAPSLTWKMDENTSLTLLTSYQKDPEGGYYGILPTVGSLWDSPIGNQIPRSFNDGDTAFSEYDREQYTLGYEFSHQFNDVWTLRHNLRYQKVDAITADVATGSLASDGHTINRYALTTDESTSGITSDLQMQASFASGLVDHTLLMGWDYQYSDSTQDRQYGMAPSIDYLNPQYGIATSLTLSPFMDQDQTLRQSGFYLQDQMKINNWTFLLGGRFDEAQTDTDNHLTGVSQTQKDNKFSGKAGLVYGFDNGLATYASYSTSFLPVSGTDFAGDALDPTTAKQYEIGLKFEPQGFDGRFTLAYFDITQEDVVTVINPVMRYQTGEVRSKGLEFEARLSLTDQTNLLGAFTYNNAEITKSIGYDRGDSPVAIPDYTASLWVDHRIVAQGLLNGLTLGGGVRYVGKSIGGYSPNAFTLGAERLNVPSYTLWDTIIGYDLSVIDPGFDGLTARLNVTNLTDETYVTCLANNFCNYGNGRAVYATLNYKW